MMEKWIDQAESYLAKTLGLSARFTAAPEVGQWPLHLVEAYDVRRCSLAGAFFLALLVRAAEPGADTLAKHADWIRQRTGLRSLFVFAAIGLRQRRRLIEAKIPFLCPDNQLYLPDLGLDLREQVKAAPKKVSQLAPATQVLLLACLHRKIIPGEPFTGVSLGARFGYTKMTMARALEELRQFQWVETEGNRQTSRHRFVIGGRELWEQARPRLRSPVTKRLYLEEWFPGEKFKAGESALEELTLLGWPRRATWAVTPAQWKILQHEPSTHLIPEAAKDTAHAEFELWRYAPALLAAPPLVDALSLALSFQNHPDERIQMSVDDVLRKFPW
jgi:DNA-binding MarR family transcriptional regulator